MVRKCYVTSCKSNYLSKKEKVTMYRLPSDPEERQRWIKAIPRDIIPDSPNTVVCVKYFPPGFPVWRSKETLDQKTRHPVSENIPKSLISTPPPPKRPTKKVASSSRSEVLHDELSTFLKNDSIPLFETLCTELPQHKFENLSWHHISLTVN